MANLLHFGISMLLSMILTVACPDNVSVAIGFTSGVGIGKEVGDYMNYGEQVGNAEFAKMAMNDLLIDSLGIFTGVITGLVINEFWEE